MSDIHYTTIKALLETKPHERDWRESVSAYLRFLDHRPGEWIAMQALHCKQVRGAVYLPAGTYTAFADTEEVAADLCTEIETREPQGIYVLHNRLAVGVQARQSRRTWVLSEKGDSLTNNDFRSRRAVYIDLDPERPRGVSATKAEMALAFKKAAVIWDKLAELLAAILPTGVNPASPLGFGASGNGAQIHVALEDLAPSKEVEDLSKRLLEAADRVWSDAGIKVDTTPYDIKRLAPAFGTVKRKGSSDDESGRVHRRSWFTPACELPWRLSLNAFRSLVEAVEQFARAETEAYSAGDDVSLEDHEPEVRPRNVSASNASNEDRLKAARDLPIPEVAAWLGLVEGDALRCPGCGETSGVGVHPKSPNLLHCFHARCASRPNRTPIDLVIAARGLTTDKEGIKAAYAALAAQFGLPELRAPGRPRKDGAAPKAPPPPPASTGADWEEMLTRNPAGVVLSTEDNASIVLSHTWRDALRWNTRARRIEFGSAPPTWPEDIAPSTTPSMGAAWTDEDTSRLVRWLQRAWRINISQSAAYSTARLLADRSCVDSLRTEVESRRGTWDGVRRVDTWLSAYIGAEDSEYTRSVGRWWLISAIARVMRPGCKVDTMLILEGPQGALKSSACRTLVGAEWFTDSPIDIESKDAYLRLAGPWVIELAELTSLSKAEAARIKAFISSQVDTYRPPYGAIDITQPRGCVFIGTVNPEGEGYLRDATGGRRFWPVRVGTIDIDALARDRDQIWAEALALYEAGEKWWPSTPEEHARCGEEQDSRRQADAWEAAIAEYIATETEVTVAEVLERALKIDVARQGRMEQTRCGSVLHALGWESSRRMVDGRKVRVYTRTAKAAPKSEVQKPGSIDDSMIDMLATAV